MDKVFTANLSHAQTKQAPQTNPKMALRLLWYTLWLVIIAISVGGTWDMLWHATQPFDGFWSPPHIFVYVTCTIAGGLLIAMTFIPGIRQSFGQGFKVIGLPFRVPGALFLIAGSMALVGFAGMVLDNLWHTNFGLNETSWSTPHSMIGWSVLGLSLGFIACRLALRNYKPLRWYVILLLGFLFISATARPIMGVYHANHTPATVQLIAEIPVLKASPDFQNTVRITLKYNLTRENPVLILLAALWGGAGLAFLRKLDSRWWLILLVVFIHGLLDNQRTRVESISQIYPQFNDPRNYLDIPLFLPTVLLLLLVRFRVPEKWAYLASGLLLGLMIYGVWATDRNAFLLVPLAAPLMLVGKKFGEQLWDIVEKPFTLRKVMAVILLIVIVPCITGIFDFYMRYTTP
jgi:hypothetical protein